MRSAIVLSVLFLFAGACKKEKPADSTTATATGTKPAAAGLASITIPNARTAADQILTGGQPTDEHLQQAKDSGVKVVLNLRTQAEENAYATEVAKVESLGMKYVHLPIDGKTGDGLNEENARKLAEVLAEKPALVHCTSGERVGALFALKAFYVDKLPADAALKVGKDNGLTMPKIEAMVADIMAKTKAKE
jgi:uncharacterized protein (TIGR01244 family)